VATSIPPPQHVVEINERYMADWVTFGLAELSTYLHRHAMFAAWCQRHNRKEPE
jgi:hypothetical protein